MSDLIVFGTGSFAEVAHFYFQHDTPHRVVAFTVHQSHIDATEFLGLPLVSFESIEQQFSPETHKMFIAVGQKGVNRVRASLCGEARSKGYELVTYISSRCTYWGEYIGDNCFLFEDNTIQPFVRIGNNVIMWSGNHIGHHSTIGDNCFITSHVVVSGHVRVGPNCFLGVNATIRDGITLGAACVVGAGALIMKSTQDNEVYIAKRTYPDPRTSDELGL